MTKEFAILDEREIWHIPACSAAIEFGYDAKRIFTGTQMPMGAVGFIRTHADPQTLRRNKEDYIVMDSRGDVIQDAAQVEVYENKTEQFRRWGTWMPDTWVFTDRERALAAVHDLPYPIVSKANEGASSVNVRIINSAAHLAQHIYDVFEGRVFVHACSGVQGRTRFPQRGYVFLQRFIPHTVTWRVNAIGNARAIFKRFCYKNKPVAQTGNVVPVLALDDFTHRLLEYSNGVFANLNTKWCAIDILHDTAEDRFKLLETSLAWPWPSPGDCMRAPLFGSSRVWGQMWHCMFDQIEEDVWARPV